MLMALIGLAPTSASFLLRCLRLPRRSGPGPDRGQRSLAQDVAAVREMAGRFRISDPGFASDLCAAADRTEAAADARAARCP